jgi:hypothetical protein
MDRALMFCHIHARAAKTHAFHFQAHALFHGAVAAGLDLAARAQHAMPGQRRAAFTQHGRHLPMAARIPGDCRHLAVGSDLAAWNHQDRAPNRQLGLGRLSDHSPTAYRTNPLAAGAI